MHLQKKSVFFTKEPNYVNIKANVNGVEQMSKSGNMCPQNLRFFEAWRWQQKNFRYKAKWIKHQQFDDVNCFFPKKYYIKSTNIVKVPEYV